MNNTRVLSEKGRLTVPVQLRRTLGLYNKTAVDIKLGNEDGVMLVMKAKPHCLICGKVGRSLMKIKNSYICSDCHSDAEPIKDSTSLHISDIVDNYCFNLDKIKNIKRENIEYERIIQENGLSEIDTNNKTVSLSGNTDNEVQVQMSYTVKEPTDAGYESILPYMNEKVYDSYITPVTVKKYDMSSQFKTAVSLMYSGEYSFIDPVEFLTRCNLSEEVALEVWDSWKNNIAANEKKLLSLGIDDRDIIDRLSKCHNLRIIKSVFPKVHTQKDIDFILDCLIVTDSVKIKTN